MDNDNVDAILSKWGGKPPGQKTNAPDDLLAKWGGSGAQPSIPVPGPASAPMGSNSAGNFDPSALIKKYFPPDQWHNAFQVMQAESGGRPDAVGDTYPIHGETIPSYGLFQIRGLPGRPDPQTLLDPEKNVAYAAQLYQRSGWGPWTAAHKLGLVN